MNLSFEVSATNKKADIRLELIAAINKCSGVHLSFIVLGNSGGIGTSILLGILGELRVPRVSEFQIRLTP
jgi:hypothetical protein